MSRSVILYAAVLAALILFPVTAVEAAPENPPRQPELCRIGVEWEPRIQKFHDDRGPYQDSLGDLFHAIYWVYQQKTYPIWTASYDSFLLDFYVLKPCDRALEIVTEIMDKAIVRFSETSELRPPLIKILKEPLPIEPHNAYSEPTWEEYEEYQRRIARYEFYVFYYGDWRSIR